MLYAMWLLAGWCGTPFPGWPRPKPQPDPWWPVKIASMLGGLAGGFITQRILGGETGSIAVLTTLAGAVVAGGFLGGLVGLMAGGRGNVAVGQ